MNRQALLSGILLIAISPLQQVSNSLPSFEVASVKENHSTAELFLGCANGATAGPAGIAAGRCRAVNVPLFALIAEAYSVPILSAEQYLAGLPRWAFTEKYDIEAAASDPSASRAELRLMLQSLFADRFKLKLHEETKEVNGFALVVAKGGFKAKPIDMNAPRNPLIRVVATIRGLIQSLENSLGAPIIDKTNITGNFDLFLPRSAYNDESGPSVVTVLEERFGLKLESAKIPVRKLIIDHVEKPVLR